MVKREHAVIDLTADDHDGEPAAQRRRVQVEPDHLLCPITREMFRDPVMVLESGHTYEREAIEQHLKNHRTDPLTRARIDTAPVTNMNTRNAVQAWLDENPGVTPDGWKTREVLPPQRVATNLSSLSPPAEADLPEQRIRVLEQMRREIRRLVMIRELRRSEADSSEMLMPLREPRHTRTVRPDRRTQRPTMSPTSNFTISSSTPRRRGRSAAPTRSPDPSMEYHRPDLEVLCEWRESCPELRDLWRGDDAGLWDGVWLSNGRVTRLTLSNKQLSGQLPRLDGLTSLREVDLHGNQLSGPIPEKLFEGLTSLWTVNLSCNRLSGPIPEKLFEGLTSLEEFWLSNNELSGAIPEKLFDGLTSLGVVNLYSNQLTGPIPEKLFEGLTSLEVVRLYGNRLSGPIPEKLFEGLTSLERVDLSTNRLSCPIPEKLFEGLTSLRRVDLCSNQLLGSIPERLRAVVTL